LGVEADFFPGEDASEELMVAMFGSKTELSDPTLWFSFDHRNGEVAGFQFHEEYAHLEYGSDDLMEWWEARLQKLTAKITGLSLIDGGLPVVDGQHRRVH
jgi:hypothetical protein